MRKEEGKGKAGKNKYKNFTKYDPTNKNLRSTFDHIYLKELPKFGIKANMVVLSGEAIETYIKYAEANLAKNGKMVSCELEKSRAARLKAKVKKLTNNGDKIARRTKIIRADVFTYDNVSAVRKFMKTPARIEDLAVGCCSIVKLTQEAIIRLLRQQKVNKNTKKKVQILNGVRRGRSDFECINAFNLYLLPLRKKVVKVNGIDVRPGADFWQEKHTKNGIFTLGQPLNGESSKKNCPLEHTVILEGNSKRFAELTFFTFSVKKCAMLTSVLKYK